MNEAGMGRRPVDQDPLQPWRDSFEPFLPGFEHGGVGQEGTHVALVAAGREGVEEVVGHALAGRGEFGEESGADAALQPADDPHRVVVGLQRVQQRQ
ncbi:MULTISPECIES: hypothetical protein [unclassified Streptomyces]|uniref:hypothetical protein n=1 Tax=unclassified Streptomyces TaxID=2593676 RepID=UPI0012FF1C54|nr:hypothetical protein [Streptomyces sp. Root264]